MADQEEIDIILKGQFKDGKLVIDQTKKLQKNLDSIDDSQKQADKSANSYNSTLKKIAAFTGFTILANQAKNLVKGSLQAAGAMEQVNIALSTMLGSGEKAAKLQKDLINFAKKTPFEIEGIFGTTKQLLAFGIEQENIISTMKTLGNIASGLGVPMSQLALVFGQVKAAGKLMGQDLLQFTNAGVPLLDELSKMLGKSKGEIIKLKEQGKISFDQVKAALEGMAGEGGRFFNLMEKQSQSFLGTVSNLSDGFFSVKNALGNALLPVAKDVVNSMMGSFTSLAKTIEDNKDKITKFAAAIVTGFRSIGSAISFAFSVLGNFIVGVKTLLSLPMVKETIAAAAAILLYSKGVAALTIAFRVLTTTSLGWISVLVAATTAIGYFSKGIEAMPNFIKIAALEAYKAFTGLKAVVDDVVASILDKLSLLSNVPGFGWIDDAKKRFESLRDEAINDIIAIDAEIKNLKQAQVAAPEIEAPQTPEVAPIKTSFAETEDEASRLKRLKAENKALLEEQRNFLAGWGLNQSEADRIALENENLKLQEKLLQNKEYAARKVELDQQLANDEITVEDYKAGLEQMQRDAKNEALQAQYESELEAFQEAQSLKNELELEMQGEQDAMKLEQLQAQLASVELAQSESAARIAQLKSQSDQKSFEEEKAGRIKQYQSNLKMDSDGYKAAQGAANELVALQNSKNKELAAIGKAAAIFQITNDTARGAMSAYASLAGIPIVGPGLGAAAAAAVIAYGAERIASTANSFAVGTPEIPEDQMAMVHQGEMIIPATFSDAIRSGDLTLGAGNQDETASGAPVINIFGAGDAANQDIGGEAQNKVTQNEEENQALLAQNEAFLTAKQEQETEFAAQNPSPYNMPLDQKVVSVASSNQVELEGLAQKNAEELKIKQKHDKDLLDQRKKNDKANQNQDKANEAARQALKKQQMDFDYAQLQQASKNQAQSATTSIQNDGASGAQSAYKAMAGIPIVGPALGAIEAARVLAHAAQMKGQVNSFAVGAAEIPQDQIAQIHAGEMIIPSDFASSIRSGDLTLGTKDDNSAVNLSVNFSFEESQFVEDRDKFIEEMSVRMAELIYEDVIPAIPTRTA